MQLAAVTRNVAEGEAGLSNAKQRRLLIWQRSNGLQKVRDAESPSPARESRALPDWGARAPQSKQSNRVDEASRLYFDGSNRFLRPSRLILARSGWIVYDLTASLKHPTESGENLTASLQDSAASREDLTASFNQFALSRLGQVGSGAAFT